LHWTALKFFIQLLSKQADVICHRFENNINLSAGKREKKSFSVAIKNKPESLTEENFSAKSETTEFYQISNT